MDGGTVVFKFEGDTTSLQKDTKKISTSVGDIAKGSLIAKGVAKAIQIVNSNLDDSISRLDTLNAFPKVMSSLGISAEDSNKALEMVNQSILGLPTTLDDAVSAVQRFTTSNGDVKRSAQMFQAVNDALVAGRSSTEMQASALEQLSQAYSKGKPDMLEWKSLMMTMPSALKQVADSMGYVNVDALGDDLRNGKVSMDEFMDTLIQLDTIGTDSFASLSEQAHGATDGIGTSLTNLKTAIVRGLANAIGGISDAMEEQGLGSISDNIQKVTDKVNQLFKSIDWNSVVKGIKTLMPVLTGLATGFAVFNVISNIVQKISMLKQAFTLLGAAAGGPITLIIAAIAALIAAFIYLWNTSDGFRNFWINCWNVIKNFFIGIWTAISGFFTETIPAIFNNFITFFTSIPTKIGELITSIINWFTQLPYNIGLAIGNIIGTLIKFVTEDIPNFITSLLTKLAELPGKIWELIQKIGSFLLQLPFKIIELKIQMVQKFVEMIQSIWNYMRTAVPNLVSNIFNWFKELPRKMLEIGKNIVSGIWNGIQNMKNEFKNKINSFFKGIVDGVKNKLGIHSPSKVFMEIGGYMDAGLIEGIDNMKTKVQDSIDGVVNVSPSVYGSATNNLSPNINVINNVDVTSDPLGQIVSQIKTFSGGAKNDYNYGMGV